METTKRTIPEKVTIAVLILLSILILTVIQLSLLIHIAGVLPTDPYSRFITIGCFLSAPFLFGFLVVYKLNYSLSFAQDAFLIIGMMLELAVFLFVVIGIAMDDKNLEALEMVGWFEVIIPVATTTITLAVDPSRQLEKQKIAHDIETYNGGGRSDD